ncbi:hypothetical protein [Bacillus sp. FJAT-27251]|uniref:hypothetical protein n=1 Tax=Bacillus sp. FJAT-27251 TaxID=1684142 RepID=UPI0006A7DB3A|nr:hypothetical protein [Bacillus sp. FJAT-27251]
MIGTEGAKTPAGVRGRGDPAGALAPRRLPGTPAESEAPGVEINRPMSINKKLSRKVSFLDKLSIACSMLFFFSRKYYNKRGVII